MLDGLTLDQMRMLVAVVDEGSFSAAARRLGRVQSAVSQAMQTLETTLALALFDRTGRVPVLTPAGEAILEGARRVLAQTDALRNRADAMRGGIEPELAIAVDAIFPTGTLMASLRALQDAFPLLPLKLMTEGLGAAEYRLRNGDVDLAICSPRPNTGIVDFHTEFLTQVQMIPVVAADHPLAAAPQPVAPEVIDAHVQLVLTDRSPLSANLRGSVYGSRIWRFADMTTRLDYLLAGFGWCHMPDHIVSGLIAAGRLKRLSLVQSNGFQLTLDVCRMRGQRQGRAAAWLIDDLRRRLCPPREAEASSPIVPPAFTAPQP